MLDSVYHYCNRCRTEQSHIIKNSITKCRECGYEFKVNIVVRGTKRSEANINKRISRK